MNETKRIRLKFTNSKQEEAFMNEMSSSSNNNNNKNNKQSSNNYLDLLNRETVYEFAVIQIQKSVLPEWNNEFARSVHPNMTIHDLDLEVTVFHSSDSTENSFNCLVYLLGGESTG